MQRPTPDGHATGRACAIETVVLTLLAFGPAWKTFLFGRR